MTSPRRNIKTSTTKKQTKVAQETTTNQETIFKPKEITQIFLGLFLGMMLLGLLTYFIVPSPKNGTFIETVEPHMAPYAKYRETTYVNDVKNGVENYYDNNDNIIRTIHYENGIMKRGIDYLPTGQVIAEATFNQVGKIVSKKIYKNGDFFYEAFYDEYGNLTADSEKFLSQQIPYFNVEIKDPKTGQITTGRIYDINGNPHTLTYKNGMLTPDSLKIKRLVEADIIRIYSKTSIGDLSIDYLLYIGVDKGLEHKKELVRLIRKFSKSYEFYDSRDALEFNWLQFSDFAFTEAFQNAIKTFRKRYSCVIKRGGISHNIMRELLVHDYINNVKSKCNTERLSEELEKLRKLYKEEFVLQEESKEKIKQQKENLLLDIKSYPYTDKCQKFISMLVQHPSDIRFSHVQIKGIDDYEKVFVFGSARSKDEKGNFVDTKYSCTYDPKIKELLEYEFRPQYR